MRVYIITLAALLALFLAAFPVFAEETEEAKSEEGEKTVIIKMTAEGERTEISSSDGEEYEIILDCEGMKGLCEGEEGVAKIIIKCPEGECPDLSELDVDMEELEAELGDLGCRVEVHEITDADGIIRKEIRISPGGEFPDIGKFEMEFDVDLDEGDLSGEKMTITMIVDDDGEKVTIKARGDKEKLKPEIDDILEELSEDGGKVTTKELEDGYDITIK